MSAAQKDTQVIRACAVEALHLLRRHPNGLPLSEIVASLKRVPTVRSSEPTVRNALRWLRDVRDAPLEYQRGPNRWILHDPTFSLPLVDPGEEDLTAVMFAAAALQPIADDALCARLDRLIEDLDDSLRAGGRGPAVRPQAVTATVTSATPVRAEVVRTLLRAAGRAVVRIGYQSPWHPEQARTYDVEPWQLRLHDGAMYLRAYSRTSGGPRNFRVAHIATASATGEPARHAVPPRDQIWGADDPAFGIDEDRPGTATFRVRGGMARWLSRTSWHPHQRDRWIEPDEVLERTLPYRSCRELARKLMTLGDALETVAPEELRDEVRAHARALAKIES